VATAAEYGLGPNTYPRGWFIVAESHEIEQRPIGVTFFGRDFVIYRGESGNPVMLDAYCKHMGTHLGKNTSAMLIVADVGGKRIEGDAIRCPITAGVTTQRAMSMTFPITMDPAQNLPLSGPIP